jgi:hypothetical protein
VLSRQCDAVPPGRQQIIIERNADRLEHGTGRGEE